MIHIQRTRPRRKTVFFKTSRPVTITLALTSCAAVNDLVTNTCSTLRADLLRVIFVADFLRFSLNRCKVTRVEIFIMTSQGRRSGPKSGGGGGGGWG